MDVTPLIRRDTQVIQSYKGGVFKVSGKTYTQSILVMADKIVLLPSATDLTVLTALKGEIDVLLYGTGERLVMPSLAFRQQIKEQLGLTLEAMDNGAAARTYNVLMAEGRKVAAALTIPE